MKAPIDNKGGTGLTRMNPARFEALAVWARSTMARVLFEEGAHWSTEDERVLGAVTYDNTDHDFGFIVLGRDKARRYRAVDLGVSFFTRRQAELALRQSMISNAARPNKAFYQGDESVPLNFFKPIVRRDKLHANFTHLLKEKGFSSALGIIREMANVFSDPDGNFVKDFQSTGFNARIWELYLFAALVEQGFTIDRKHDRPDFIVSKGPESVAIEAVTVNASEKARDEGALLLQPSTAEEIARLLEDYMPLKFGGALLSKVRKEYWKLDHVAGRPFVIAIADFHAPQSMTWSGSALTMYLYGLRWKHTRSSRGKPSFKTERIVSHLKGNEPIPSNFFGQEANRFVSAILFTNQGTLSKFNRMGCLADFGDPSIRLIRRGFLQDPDPNATVPRLFQIDIDHPSCSEGWSDEIDVFHNPNAVIPLDANLFPMCTHHFLQGDRLMSTPRPHKVLGSMTMILVKEKSRKRSRKKNASARQKR